MNAAEIATSKASVLYSDAEMIARLWAVCADARTISFDVKEHFDGTNWMVDFSIVRAVLQAKEPTDGNQ